MEVLKDRILAFTGESLVDKELHPVAGKVLDGDRITPEEGLLLFERGDIGFLGMLAEFVRRKKNGDEVFFIRNFHIEPTNVCVNKCRFCSFSHHFSREQWELTPDEILGKVREQDAEVREVHITGAVHPNRDIVYYGELLKEVRALRPDLHIKAYSAVELDYMIKKSGMNFGEGLAYLRECGLDSIPGGGAEIFDETIRTEIAGMKSTSEDWLAIHETAHRMGISSNATMLYGHVETYAHRVDHMERLRQLQDRTGGFNAFIPLKFRNKNHELGDIPEVPVTEDMRNYAVSRIYLDNFPHLKAYWPAIGKKNAQMALAFGVDDLDGTINDSTRIYSLAGAGDQNPVMTTSEMEEFIRQAGRIPVERDSLYRKIPAR
jgi:aminodeoxyfutalosine synthase